jgi:Zn-dependent protease/CBS domain-containing protein
VGVSDHGLGAPARRGDRDAIRIGSVGGIDVLVRWSWFLMAFLIALLLAPLVQQAAPALTGGLTFVAGVAFAVLLALSLLLHELSHALMSRHFGIEVRSITLHFIGGVTAIDGEPATPKEELAISAIGPVTSLGIGGAAYLLLQVTPDGLLSLVVGLLAWANIVVGVLNLVPGMPLDGGRVLRALVWKLTGDPHRGLLVSGWAGRGVAVLALLSPAMIGASGRTVDVLDYVLAAVIGWFLWSAATGAVLSAKVRARLPRLQARRLARRTVTVPEQTPLAEAVRLAREHRAGGIVALDPHGRPTGLVNEGAVRATPPERHPWVPVAAVTRTLAEDLTLPADIGGEALVRAMARAPASEYLLVEPDGAVYGVLVTADVDAAFSAG